MEKQRRDGNQRRGEKRPKQRLDKMGLALLQNGAVIHDRGSQVSQIALAEEGQRDAPQLFRKARPPHARFHIGRQEGAVILQPCADEDQCRRRDAADAIKGDARRPQRAAQHIPHKLIKQPNGQHEGNILQGAAENALDCIDRTLMQERKTSL